MNIAEKRNKAEMLWTHNMAHKEMKEKNQSIRRCGVIDVKEVRKARLAWYGHIIYEMKKTRR